jgi:hypothetical protein
MRDGLIWHDPDPVRDCGENLAIIATWLRSSWTQFNEHLLRMGDIFGDDDVGGLIGASHSGAVEIATSSFNSIAAAFDSFGARLAVAADNYEQAEQQITQRFQGLGG